jgi:DNA-binding transcriptional LysR family regulator
VLEQTVAGSRATPRGLLRVHGTLGFGRRQLAPALSAFARQHADVEVQLSLGDRPVNLVEQGIDVAVTVGGLPDGRLTARRLAPNHRLLCASARYLRQAGEPARPSELAVHQCIVLRESDETFGTWHLRQGRRQETVKVRGRMATNDGDTALQWALDGHGILLRSVWDAAPYLRTGRLRPVLPDWRSPDAEVSAVYPTRQNLSARTRACVDFLADWFTKHPLPTWP